MTIMEFFMETKTNFARDLSLGNFLKRYMRDSIQNARFCIY